jgi:hypothetical protein
VDFLIVNKNRLPPSFAEQLKALESELYSADQMFDEEGYMVLAVNKMGSYIDHISGMVNVADKLGRQFLELKF